MKNVVIFSGYYYPHLGGIERYIDNMMRELIRNNYKPILVTSNYNNSVSYEEVNGISIYRLPVYNIFKNRYPIIKKNSEYRRIIKCLDKYDIESIIVNTRFHLTSHIGALYGNKRDIPVFLIEHGSNYVTLDNKFIDFFANRYEDILTARIKKYITGFYGVSNACGKWLKNFKIKSSGTWYNSINFNTYKRISHKGTNFMYAGRLLKQKGVDNILDSFSKLEKKYNNIHLYIAGDGPEYNKYINNYPSKNITFLGKLSYEELLDYYAKTDIFLYTPLWAEGLPTSILESGMMGCAVICTNEGGIREVVNKSNGIILSNINNLYKSMEKLLLDKSLRKKLSKELNKTIKNNFSWDVTIKKIIKDMEVK